MQSWRLRCDVLCRKEESKPPTDLCQPSPPLRHAQRYSRSGTPRCGRRRPACSARAYVWWQGSGNGTAAPAAWHAGHSPLTSNRRRGRSPELPDAPAQQAWPGGVRRGRLSGALLPGTLCLRHMTLPHEKSKPQAAGTHLRCAGSPPRAQGGAAPRHSASLVLNQRKQGS